MALYVKITAYEGIAHMESNTPLPESLVLIPLVVLNYQITNDTPPPLPLPWPPADWIDNAPTLSLFIVG